MIFIPKLKWLLHISLKLWIQELDHLVVNIWLIELSLPHEKVNTWNKSDPASQLQEPAPQS